MVTKRHYMHTRTSMALASASSCARILAYAALVSLFRAASQSARCTICRASLHTRPQRRAREDRQEDTQTGPTDANGFVRVTANGHVARAALLAEGATTDATIASWTGKVEFEFAFLSCDVFGCGVTCGDGGV